ncbi:MAG: Flp pilus assembly protein CpaB [Pseudomonadota bacterium]
MRIVFVLVLFIGIVLAGTAVFFVQQRFNAYEGTVRQLVAERNSIERVEMADIVVATENLRYGHTLTEDDLTTIRWPAEELPDNTFTSIEEMFETASQPIIVLSRIFEKEPINTQRISGFGLDPGIASRLTPGFRAFTINVDVSTGVSGFLSPGDRVDVFWTGRDGRQNVTRLLIDNIEIIAVDQTAIENRNRANVARTVTVEATPAQTAVLAQAQASGRLSLSLRGIADTENAGDVQIDQFDITGREREVEEAPAPPPAPVVIIQQAEPEPEPAPEPRRIITIRRGTQASTIEAD